MHTRSVLAILSAILFPLPLLAQSCPQQTTQHVPGSTENGPPTACTGIDYSFAGVAVSTTASACPTFAIYTPPHEIAIGTAAETKVRFAGHSPITLITFQCDRSYLLFIPLSSSCEVSGTSTIGSVLRLITVPC